MQSVSQPCRIRISSPSRCWTEARNAASIHRSKLSAVSPSASWDWDWVLRWDGAICSEWWDFLSGRFWVSCTQPYLEMSFHDVFRSNYDCWKFLRVLFSWWWFTQLWSRYAPVFVTSFRSWALILTKIVSEEIPDFVDPLLVRVSSRLISVAQLVSCPPGQSRILSDELMLTRSVTRFCIFFT
jgi:hypothetical protein